MRTTVPCRLFPLCLNVLMAAGCYTYQPVSAPPPSGTEVRVTLEDERSFPDVRPDAEVDGTLIGSDEETVVLLLPRMDVPRRYRRGDPRPDTIRVARRQVTRLEERQFSTTRTLLLAGGVATAVALVVDLTGEREGSADFPTGDQDPVKSLLKRLLPP